VYKVLVSEGVRGDLKGIKAYDQRAIVDQVEKQLKHEPRKQTRNRKLLHHLIPPFEAIAPIWELKVGDYRVFYDVGEEEKTVYVRAVRKKLPHQTTEEIL